MGVPINDASHGNKYKFNGKNPPQGNEEVAEFLADLRATGGLMCIGILPISFSDPVVPASSHFRPIEEWPQEEIQSLAELLQSAKAANEGC